MWPSLMNRSFECVTVHTRRNSTIDFAKDDNAATAILVLPVDSFAVVVVVVEWAPVGTRSPVYPIEVE